jgi:hypothetical protein
MSDRKFYILDSRDVVGNCASWWRPDSAGYTCNLDEAGVYGEEKLGGLRPTDFPVPVELAESLAVRHVRMDELRYEDVVAKQFKALKRKALDELQRDCCPNCGDFRYVPCDDRECFLCATERMAECPNAQKCDRGCDAAKELP